MATTINGYSPEATYIIYKLYRKGFVGNHQSAAEGIQQISRSSAGSEFDLSEKEADKLVEKLKDDNVIIPYNDRDSWKLNHKFVKKHKDTLEEMKTEGSEVNRIL